MSLSNQNIIRLQADYFGSGLWWSGKRSGPINLAPFPISELLRSEVLAWQAEFDGTLDRITGVGSGFQSADAAERFDEKGRQLWQRLAEELPEFEVEYFCEAEHRIMRPSERRAGDGLN